MPIAETDLLQLLKLNQAKEHSQQFRGGIHAGISHMHKQGWVHSDIKPDNILIHSDFGLTTRQGTGPTLVGGQLTYSAVYAPYSTIDLAQANVHVNRDWFAFTVVTRCISTRRLTPQIGGCLTK